MAKRQRTDIGNWLQLAATLLFATALTAILIIGIRRTAALTEATAALHLASELSDRPQIVLSDLTLVQRGLDTVTLVGDALHNTEEARAAIGKDFQRLRNSLRGANLYARSDIASDADGAFRRWQGLDVQLEALEHQRADVLYQTTAAGTELSPAGQQMKAMVDGALATQRQSLRSMTQELSRLGTNLRSAVSDLGAGLRDLLLAGTAVAATLLSLMIYYAWRSRQSAASATVAQRQVRNILGTVREGLFLVGRDMRLGVTHSKSLKDLLRVESPAGMRFEDILRPLVDEKTLLGAQKFISLLWKDRVHDELIDSINPLNEVEITFDGPHGSRDTRFVAFSFRRIRGGDNSGDFILGVVTDVTERVLLARELEHVKSEGNSHAALLLQLLQLDPQQLQGFLGSADVAFRKSNAMLTTPGITHEELLAKLNGVFRELHAIKGEAGALGLQGFAQRIHKVEDTLAALRSKPTLCGNDFVPVVVKLDELMSHLENVHGLQERIAGFRAAPVPAAPAADADHRSTVVISPPRVLQPGPAAARGNGLEEMLCTLAQTLGKQHGRAVRVSARGLERVPPKYLGVVKDVSIQMLRNAVVHGIENPTDRQQAGKSLEGHVQVTFETDSPEDYQLTFEDDGRGLSYERIMDHALRAGLVRPQQAASLDKSSVFRLIFQPGFTTAEQVTEDAGRGVGLDAVGSLIRSHGGRIGVATTAGQFTRFKMLLPKLAAAQRPPAARSGQRASA